MEQLINKVASFVTEYMSQFDASHDHYHIKRVVGLAQTIEDRERKLHPTKEYRSDLVVLCSLLHDVGDGKYVKPEQDGKTMAKEILLKFGADTALASDVQDIINNVSYSVEIKDPSKVQECLDRYPELGIVQDADRLDAIGAVGVARCFAWTGRWEKSSLQDGIDHFQDKLVKLESMMKTESGKSMAAVRAERLNTFRNWWVDEVEIQKETLLFS